MHTDAKKGFQKLFSQIFATTAVLLIAWLCVPSFWFWTGFEFVAAVLVAIGCTGEWYFHHHPAGKKKREQDEHHKVESRFIAAVVFGVSMEIFALGHTITEGVELEKRVVELNKATLELAHQYDLSTNALAEANARLLSVSNVAEMNSPVNLPIRSLKGYCVIGINKNTAPHFVVGQISVFRLLRAINSTDEVDCAGQLQYIETNRLGDVMLTIDVNGERGKSAGIWSGVSFNNVRVVHIDFASSAETPFEIKGGFLRITVDSLFEAEFRFPSQTNKTEYPYGFFGFRDR